VTAIPWERQVAPVWRYLFPALVMVGALRDSLRGDRGRLPVAKKTIALGCLKKFLQGLAIVRFGQSRAQIQFKIIFPSESFASHSAPFA
jgi:hypothetical protein